MTEAKRRGQTILLTGPTLAGKTTTAMMWAAERSRVTSPLDWDQLRDVLFGDRLRWDSSADVGSQYRFAAKIAAATADQITASGVDCVISGARVPASSTDPPEWWGMWDDLDPLDPITIVLLPSVEARLERRQMDPNRCSSGRFPISEEHIRDSQRWAWRSWDDHPRAAVLDTSDLSEEEVVIVVERAVSKLSDQQ